MLVIGLGGFLTQDPYTLPAILEEYAKVKEFLEWLRDCHFLVSFGFGLSTIFSYQHMAHSHSGILKGLECIF